MSISLPIFRKNNTPTSCIKENYITRSFLLYFQFSSLDLLCKMTDICDWWYWEKERKVHTWISWILVKKRCKDSLDLTEFYFSISFWPRIGRRFEACLLRGIYHLQQLASISWYKVAVHLSLFSSKEKGRKMKGNKL